MTEDTKNSSREKLESLRKLIADHHLDGYLVSHADEFQNEYLPERAERLAWLTGFTGSAGAAVILKDKAAVFSDGRYTIQLAQEVDGALYETVTMSADKTIASWLLENALNRARIGYDPILHTIAEIQALQKQTSSKSFDITPVSDHLIDQIWTNQPAWPYSEIYTFPKSVAGMSIHQKLENVTDALEANNAFAVVLTKTDSIAWLLNVRADDIRHVPVPLSYAVVRQSGTVEWFVKNEVPAGVSEVLPKEVQIFSFNDLGNGLRRLATSAVKSNMPVQMDYQNTPIWFKKQLELMDVKVIDGADPCVPLRACKTKAEQHSIRQTHIEDGVALCKFFRWLDAEAPKGTLTEMDVVNELLLERQRLPDFHDISFDTIAGWNENGAIVHYRVNNKTNKTVTPPGLLLVDSGVQLKNAGTTDITRTVSVGDPTPEMIENFTRVLKGHIKVANLKFPKGTTGSYIEILAREALWEQGLDFAHGTGHGVGCFLSVHESGTGIHKRATTELKPGMLISNEPGYYKEGAYGIRIENLILVQESEKDGWLEFETVSLSPIDRRLIDKTILSANELKWLNNYHAHVFKTLLPHVGAEDKVWLEQATEPL